MQQTGQGGTVTVLQVCRTLLRQGHLAWAPMCEVWQRPEVAAGPGSGLLHSLALLEWLQQLQVGITALPTQLWEWSENSCSFCCRGRQDPPLHCPNVRRRDWELSASTEKQEVKCLMDFCAWGCSVLSESIRSVTVKSLWLTGAESYKIFMNSQAPINFYRTFLNWGFHRLITWPKFVQWLIGAVRSTSLITESSSVKVWGSASN